MRDSPAVVELEKLASDLEASIPRLQDDPSTYPRPIETDPNGHASQLHLCMKFGHGPYLKIRLRGWDQWTGACAQCEKERALEQKARSILPTRSVDLQRLIAERMAGCEDEIIARVEEQLLGYVEELRPRLVDAIRAEYGQQAHAQAELDLLGEIVEELNAGA